MSWRFLVASHWPCWQFKDCIVRQQVPFSSWLCHIAHLLAMPACHDFHPTSLCPCAELFPVYVIAVSECLFSAMLVVLKAPKTLREATKPDTSWPYHLANLKAISDTHAAFMMACTDGGGITHQCSYCGKAWNSKHLKRPLKVSL